MTGGWMVELLCVVAFLPPFFFLMFLHGWWSWWYIMILHYSRYLVISQNELSPDVWFPILRIWAFFFDLFLPWHPSFEGKEQVLMKPWEEVVVNVVVFMFQFQHVFFSFGWGTFFFWNGESSCQLCSTGNLVRISRKKHVPVISHVQPKGVRFAPGKDHISRVDGGTFESMRNIFRLGRFNLQYRKEGVEETTEGDEDAAPAKMRFRLTVDLLGLW